jgi:hypothetical protein
MSLPKWHTCIFPHQLLQSTCIHWVHPVSVTETMTGHKQCPPPSCSTHAAERTGLCPLGGWGYMCLSWN